MTGGEGVGTGAGMLNEKIQFVFYFKRTGQVYGHKPKYYEKIWHYC